MRAPALSEGCSCIEEDLRASVACCAGTADVPSLASAARSTFNTSSRSRSGVSVNARSLVLLESVSVSAYASRAFTNSLSLESSFLAPQPHTNCSHWSYAVSARRQFRCVS
jgi:hypothetical protein